MPRRNPNTQAFSAGKFAFPQYNAPVMSNPKKGKKMASTKVEIPKGKRSGDTFTRGGKTYVVQSFVNRNGKRVRRAMPVKATPALRKGRKAAPSPKAKRKTNPPITVAERRALVEAMDCPLLPTNTRRKLKKILDTHGGKPRN